MSVGWELSPEDIRLFLEEADELLQGIEEGILHLEAPGDHLETLRALFRHAHTLKGSAATLGHTEMAKVAHVMESILERLRQGQAQADRATIDALLIGMDALRSYRNVIAQLPAEPVDLSAVLTVLEAVHSSPTGDSRSREHLPEGPSDEESAALGEVKLLAGEAAWWVAVAVEPEAPMRSVRLYQAVLQLEQLGQMIRSWPSIVQLEQETELGPELRCLLVTSRGAEAITVELGTIPDLGPAVVTPAELPAAQPAAPVPGLTDADRPEPSLHVQTAAGGNRTIRVDVEILDTLMNLVGELVIDRTHLMQLLTEDGDSKLARQVSQTATHIGRVTSDLQDQIMRARMVPVENLFRKFPRMVRDLAQTLQKDVELVMQGEETELDRAVMEEITDPMTHLLRNALDHGIEPSTERLKAGKHAKGTVRLTAHHQDDRIVIAIRDDGRGMDPQRIRDAAVRKQVITEEAARRLSDADALNLIFAPGFSTKDQVTDVSGRGVGMDVVKQNLNRLNASVEIATVPSQGTEFRLRIPLTLAILRGILITMLGEVYALPLSGVVEILDLSSYPIQTVRGQQVIVVRGGVVPLVTGESVFGLPERDVSVDDRHVAVLVQAHGQQFALVAESLLGEQEIVIKPLGKLIGEVAGISGATILGNGDVALILDLGRLSSMARGAELVVSTKS